MTAITLNIGGSDQVLAQISESSYSSEYMLRDTTKEYRMKIRHSQEKVAKGAPSVDRHNVELTVRTFPTDTMPLGSTDQAYIVIRSNPNSNGATAVDIATTLSNFLVNPGVLEAIVGWQSDLGA